MHGLYLHGVPGAPLTPESLHQAAFHLFQESERCCAGTRWIEVDMEVFDVDFDDQRVIKQEHSGDVEEFLPAERPLDLIRVPTFSPEVVQLLAANVEEVAVDIEGDGTRIRRLEAQPNLRLALVGPIDSDRQLPIELISGREVRRFDD